MRVKNALAAIEPESVPTVTTDGAGRPVQLPRPATAPELAQLVWRRTLELAEPFDQDSLFGVLFDVLRTASHDTATVTDAWVLGRSWVSDHPADFVARRACGLLERAILFMGGTTTAGVHQSHRSVAHLASRPA
ncbi:MAG: hypothetical protein M3144_09805 [Actinomycetota bacterium]|nr:hypothetical protein [Actinomycetota bacterium]